MITNCLSLLTNKAKSLKLNKKEGEVNYFLAIAIGAVVLIIIGWPAIKGVTNSLWTTVSSWFTTNLVKIFTNLT